MPARHPAPRPPHPSMRIPPWAAALLLFLCAWGAVWLGSRIVDAIRPMLPAMMVSRNVSPLPGTPPGMEDAAPRPVQPAR